LYLFIYFCASALLLQRQTVPKKGAKIIFFSRPFKGIIHENAGVACAKKEETFFPFLFLVSQAFFLAL
jgi:hypothetical protein